MCIYVYIYIHRQMLDVLGASLFLLDTFWLEGFRCCIMLYLWVDDALRISWLVGSTPLKNMKVSWGYFSQCMEKQKMFQTTNQYLESANGC